MSRATGAAAADLRAFRGGAVAAAIATVGARRRPRATVLPDPRLGGNAQVATRQLGVQDGLLDGGKILESGFAQGGAETRGGLL